MSGCVVFEDEHLLVVNKPAGWNTHAPSPCAGEGIYDWLRHREPRWACLAIIHRLDKDTSGLLVFAKTPVASRSLTDQFTRRAVQKKYLLLTDRVVKERAFACKTALVRVGARYVSRPPHAGADMAETRFRCLGPVSAAGHDCQLWEVEPMTGRTHQIRVHASDHRMPILGDTLYGGSPAGRMFLHAAEIHFTHPATGLPIVFGAPPDFEADPRLLYRAAVVDPGATNAFRILHGASDGSPGWQIDRLGSFLLSQAEVDLSEDQTRELSRLMERFGALGAYHKTLSRHVRRATLEQSAPRLVLGQPAPERFDILENGIRFELSFQEGYSVGIFLDQRDNRRRLLTGHIAAGFSLAQPPATMAGLRVLNTFAYTCAFSVCAAKAGAHTTSLDLSKKYLEWGKRNFALNQVDPAGHDFIYGDVFDWFKRLAKKGRAYDVILLDPPTFSQSRESGVFRADKDYGRLVAAALPLLAPSGVLFASSNMAGWEAEDFLKKVESAVTAGRRTMLQRHYVPQPPDFPISREEPAYLKTAWLRIG